jgi:hypothetical protein
MVEERKEEPSVSAMMGQLLNVSNTTTLEARLIAAVETEPPKDTPREAEVIPFKIPERKPTGPTKRTVTTEHLQKLVLAGLQEIEGFPKTGVSITVYGVRPWNAMMTFAPWSISSNGAMTYREVLPQLVERLSKQFDVE